MVKRFASHKTKCFIQESIELCSKEHFYSLYYQRRHWKWFKMHTHIICICGNINRFSYNSCDMNLRTRHPQIREDLREAIPLWGHSAQALHRLWFPFSSFHSAEEFTWKGKPWFLNYYYPPEVIISVYYIIIISTCHQLYIPKEEITVSSEDNEIGTDVLLKERYPILKLYLIMKNQGKEIRGYWHTSKESLF